jgi:hypothetical protein
MTRTVKYFLALANLQSKLYCAPMAKPPKITAAVKEYVRAVASMGGKARAKKYPKGTLKKWARLGGRPPKKGRKQ